MIGLLCVHYWIIQKRVFHIPDLYEGSRKSLYWYRYGINWRTCVAWTCAVVPSMPGFVHAVNPSLTVGTGASRVFSLSFVLGFVLGKSSQTCKIGIFADLELQSLNHLLCTTLVFPL